MIISREGISVFFFPISRISLRYKSERLAEFVFPQKKGREKKTFISHLKFLFYISCRALRAASLRGQFVF